MTTLVGKFLADGQVASSEGAIYTVPSGKIAYIKKITFANTSVNTQTLIVYLRNGAGTSRVEARAVLEQNERYEFDGAIALEDGDTLRATTTNTTSVDYGVYGVEETL